MNVRRKLVAPIVTPTVALILAAVLVPVPARAGLVMKFEEHGPGAAAPTPGTAWIEKDRLKVESGGSTVIFRGDKNVAWAWSANEKTYVELTKQQAEQMGQAMAELQAQLATMSPEERAMVQQVMGGRMGAMAAAPAAAAAPLTVLRLKTTQEVHGWTCADNEVRRGTEPGDAGLVGKYCTVSWEKFGVTPTDFTVFEKLQAFIRDFTGPMASSMDSTYAVAWGEGGLPGVPVRAETRTKQGLSIHDITSLEHADVPAATFEVPAGLEKQDIGMPPRTRG